MTVSTPNEPSNKASPSSVLVICQRAKLAASKVALLSDKQRSDALLSIAAELEDKEPELVAANVKDRQQAHKLLKEGLTTEALIDRLHLTKSKLDSVISGLRQIAQMPNPLGKCELHRELDAQLELYKITCPIGLIGVIFEARPDALPQIAALCLKSGNGVILKGGAEAEHTNRALFECLKRKAVSSGIPGEAMALLESRADVSELLKAERYVDLIIPRGGSDLVRFVQKNTDIAVLGHAEGVCHIYVDQLAQTDKAIRIIVDAKTQYPAACNAAETVLVHKAIAPKLLPHLAKNLLEKGVTLRCDPASLSYLDHDIKAAPATEADWYTEYGDLVLSIKTVDTISDAIEHINQYGSGHTEAMISEDTALFEQFFSQVNSANIFLNASTRFADGFRYGFGAEVGISTTKLHPRGPVGLEGLVTYKYMIKGNGQIVADYVGPNPKSFTHKELQSLR